MRQPKHSFTAHPAPERTRTRLRLRALPVIIGNFSRTRSNARRIIASNRRRRSKSERRRHVRAPAAMCAQRDAVEPSDVRDAGCCGERSLPVTQSDSNRRRGKMFARSAPSNTSALFFFPFSFLSSSRTAPPYVALLYVHR